MSRTRKLNDLGVSAFCESMGMMVKAGIQTEEAITLLAQQDGNSSGLLARALQKMQTLVVQGRGLSEAMKQTGIFPAYAIKMIAAGEATGRLEDVLFRLSDYYKDQKTIADKIRAAITYPSTMLVMIIVVLAIMIAMVLPAFRGVYASLAGSLAGSSYGYIRWAYGFCIVALVIMVILAVALFVGRSLWNTGHRKGLEKIIRRSRMFSSVLDGLGLFRFTSALEMFLASGEMQDLAVLKSIKMTDCVPVERKLRTCAEIMEEGHSFSKAAYDAQLFEPVYGRMLLAGERSGSLEDVLHRMTSHLRENSISQVDRLVGVVDPLLSGILMLTVGLTLLSVMLPLIGIMNSIG